MGVQQAYIPPFRGISNLPYQVFPRHTLNIEHDSMYMYVCLLKRAALTHALPLWRWIYNNVFVMTTWRFGLRLFF